MGDLYLDARLKALLRAQNPDGGWGYFAGKESWLEPTAWAALALHGDPAADRAWSLLKSWQLPDGSWRPAREVHVSNWGTALGVIIAAARGEFGDSTRKGVAWLVQSEGAESSMVRRAAARVGLYNAERNVDLKGWPWKPNTSAWVEPTVHSLVALDRAAGHVEVEGIGSRIRIGRAQLLDVRCADGGWNYGSKAALDVALPSYPETTGLALIGLQRQPGLRKSLDLAAKMARETTSPLARAWLRIALALHEEPVPAQLEQSSPDLMITALEALSCENYKFLRTGAET